MRGLKLGQRATVTRVFTPEDVAEYAALAADMSAPAGGENERSGPRPGSLKVPAPLLAGLFSYLLGTELPGRGTNYLKQTLRLPAPGYSGEAITASVEVVRLRPEKQLVNLHTICTNPAGQVVCEGGALVLVSELERDV